MTIIDTGTYRVVPITREHCDADRAVHAGKELMWSSCCTHAAEMRRELWPGEYTIWVYVGMGTPQECEAMLARAGCREALGHIDIPAEDTMTQAQWRELWGWRDK
jgi:hypothetical protein